MAVPEFNVASSRSHSLVDALDELPDSAANVVPEAEANKTEDTPGKVNRPDATAEQLVAMALRRYRFGTTTERQPFAIPIAGGHVVRSLRGGSGLRSELAKLYRSAHGRVPTASALADALTVLEGEAAEQEQIPVHLRVAENDEAVWIDLGDQAAHAVRLTAGDWRVVTNGVPTLFRRTETLGTLPLPASGDLTVLAQLWELVNVDESDRPLVLAWLTSALARPGIAHPVLSLFGEQGSGKSTACRTFLRLVDPQGPDGGLLRKPPKDADAWPVQAAGSWALALDNLSGVPAWLSDSLCRAVTGDGDVRRQLYTDGDLAVFSFRRCIILNGIDVGAVRGDLAERLLAVNIRRIGEASRRTETQLVTAWEKAYPELFGALLSLAAAALAELPDVDLPTLPRMADFATWVAAVDRVLDTSGYGRLTEQADDLARDALMADPFLAAVVETLTTPFEGSAGELLSRVTEAKHAMHVEWHPPRGWPGARAVTATLARNAPGLRRAGWEVESAERGGRNHTRTWQLVPPTRDDSEWLPATPASPAAAEPSGQNHRSGAVSRPGASAGVAPASAGDAGTGGRTTPTLTGVARMLPAPVSAGQKTLAGDAGVAGDDSRSLQGAAEAVVEVACRTCGHAQVSCRRLNARLRAEDAHEFEPELERTPS